MIVAESHRSRRLVGRLDRGTDLLPALSALCRQRQVKSGVLACFGVLEEAELSGADARAPGGQAARRFAAPMTIVHLGGHISERSGAAHVEAAAALSREGDTGIVVVGGRLLAARVLSVEFVIDCFDDLIVRTAVESPGGPARFTEVLEVVEPTQPMVAPAQAAAPAVAPAAPAKPAPAVHFEARATGHVVPRPGAATAAVAAVGAIGAAASPTGRSTSPAAASTAPPAPSDRKPAGPSWAEVAAASAQAGPVPTAGEDGEGDDALRAGDVIEHPRFGRCDVERIEGGGEYAQVRLRNRRLVRLSLDVLQLHRDGRDESGHRRFRARVST